MSPWRSVLALLRSIHLFVFTFWYGTLLYFLLQAVILFKSLPRDQFGLMQSKIFPTYYLISYACGTILVVTYHLLHPLKNYVPQDCVKITVLCLMLLFSMVQGFWIGPKVAQLRVEREAAEQTKDQPQIEALTRQFGKVHGLSSLVNLLVIVSGTVYFVYLAREINP